MAMAMQPTTLVGSCSMSAQKSARSVGSSGVAGTRMLPQGFACGKKGLWKIVGDDKGTVAGGGVGIALWKREGERGVGVRSGEQAGVEVAAPVGGVTEVGKDTFWELVREAGEKLVVLDMYTQYCGPCKLMYPKVLKLSESYEDVVFMKLDCNQDNKPLAKELGVKSVPTFKVLKNGEVVAEVRGAKYDELVKAIEESRSSS